MKFLLTICFLFPFLLSAAEYAFETEAGRKVYPTEIKHFNGCRYTLTNGEEIWVYELKNPDCFRIMFGDKFNWKTMKKYPECYVVLADSRGIIIHQYRFIRRSSDLTGDYVLAWNEVEPELKKLLGGSRYDRVK